ncbi:unnamed protein product [Caenorhabditis angaria]|uniref:Sterol regulatory element-binding protein cleavage-activating protein n=1 Tax=Caenorhabditis angaria TaxID=860376 RepID=A0A9P1IFI6_9PELO|nr:unnamed protein product [Caenorhabditis angaria]
MDGRIRQKWNGVKNRVANAYHDYGRLCAAHPLACLSMSLLTMIVLSYPAVTRLRLPVSTPIDIYWSEHLHVTDKIAPSWINDNPAAYIQQFVVSTTIDPWNSTISNPEKAVRAAVASAFRIREIILDEPIVDDVCLHLVPPTSRWPFRSKSVCLVLSPASMWYNDLQKFKEDENVIDTIFNEDCKSDFCMRDLLLGAPISATGIKRNYQTNRKRTIEFSITIFFARYSKSLLLNLHKKLGSHFEIIDLPPSDDSTFVQVYYHPLKQFSDYLPLIFTYFLCMIYLYFSSRKFQMVSSRWGLAFAASFTVAATLLMTTGICAHLDLSTTLWGAELYPYIALILGMENLLCITRSVVYTPPSLDVSSRIAHGLSQEGYKLTKYFVLESFFIFCGYLTGVSDIQEFCQFSVICIIVDFYMQLFFYAPCLTFDLQRLGLEEKRRFAEILFHAEIPRLKNYGAVNCPMRKVWPKLFELKKIQKRRLSDSGVDDLFNNPEDANNKKQMQRRLSNTKTEIEQAEADSSIRMKLLYFITRTRIIQRTIMIGFAIWVVWLAFVVGSRKSGEATSLRNDTLENLAQSHRILSVANLEYGHWQRRTYKWWPPVAHEYNISLNSRYVTFLPPIIIKSNVSPNDPILEPIINKELSLEDKQDIEDTEAPILRSRIDWLEMQLKMYLAAFWLLLLTTVITFFVYVCLGDRWKIGGVKKVKEPTKQQQKSSTKQFVETLPIVFNAHRFPIETIGLDSEETSSDTFLSCCQEGFVIEWNCLTGEKIRKINRLRGIGNQQETQPKVWAISKNNDIALFGCSDGSVEIASLSRNKLIGIYSQSTLGITHIINDNKDNFVIARIDGIIEFVHVKYERGDTIRVSDIKLYKTICGHQKPVSRMIFWNNQVITSSFDRSIKIWNIENGEMTNVFLAHNAPVLNIAIDDKNKIMFSSCEESVVCWWNLETGAHIRSVDNNCNWSFQLTTSCDYLLGFYGSSNLHLWSLETGQLSCRITDASNDGQTEDTLYASGNSGVVTFDNQIAATASGFSITFWDLKHRAIIGKTKLAGKIGAMRKLTSNSVLCCAANLMYSVTVPVKMATEYPFGSFLDQHSDQLNASGVPPELWPSLYSKLVKQTFDAGDFFQIICELSENGEKNMSVLALDDIHNVDDQSIFLIDHLFTFESENARKILESNENLVKRLTDLFGLDEESDEIEDESVEKIITSDEIEKKAHEEKIAAGGDTTNVGGNLPRHESIDARLGSYSQDDEKNKIIEKIMKQVWKNALTYSVKYNDNGQIENKTLWYIMDEFGARINHSSEPNVRVVPLMFFPQGCAYNVMFLTKPIKKEEEITRDFAENPLSAQKPEWRKYLELPYSEEDFTNESTIPPQPTDSYFTSGRNPDELASLEDQETAQSALSASIHVMKSRKLKIYADDTQLIEFLTKDFELVDDWKKADVIWQYKHFHNYRELCELNPCGMVNQYPYESCLTVKDLLAACAMRNPSKNNWYQLTYNLNTQLPQFVACFQQRQNTNPSQNVWIVKPWNLARGMEMCVTDDLNKIIRLVETGPKIVCEYISRPLLFPRPDNGNRVKFDLRYIVFVNSLQPLTAYVYNKFWIRFAINDFTMSNFDDNETHFTVFNYTSGGSKILQMKCEQFIETIEKAYPKLKWTEIQNNINETIRKALECATTENAPRGVAPNTQSRAMYGIDIMLQHGEGDIIKPTLLECNFTPDCTRACQYYPDFADTVFDTLFFDEIDPTKVTQI